MTQPEANKEYTYAELLELAKKYWTEYYVSMGATQDNAEKAAKDLVLKLVNRAKLLNIINPKTGEKVIPSGMGIVDAPLKYKEVQAQNLAGFTNRLRIDIDNSKVTSALTNFPIMIWISESSGIDHVDLSAFFTVMSYANRKKIAVTTSDDTQCYTEIAYWDNTEKTALLFAKLPSLPTSASYIYVYFDPDASENTTYVGDTLDAPTLQVWGNGYQSVLHLQGNANDSGPLRNHGTVDGTVTWVAGRFGIGAQFSGSNKITLADKPEYSPYNGLTFSVEALMKITSAAYSSWHSFLGKIGTVSNQDNEWKFNVYYAADPDPMPYDNSNRRFYVFGEFDSTGSGANSSYIEATAGGEWYHEVGQVTATRVSLYEDGLSGYPGSSTPTDLVEPTDTDWNNYVIGEGDADGENIIADTDSTVKIGYANNPGLECVMQEIRISNVNRSAAWVRTDDYNLKDELLTYSVEMGSCGIGCMQTTCEIGCMQSACEIGCMQTTTQMAPPVGLTMNGWVTYWSWDDAVCETVVCPQGGPTAWIWATLTGVATIPIGIATNWSWVTVCCESCEITTCQDTCNLSTCQLSCQTVCEGTCAQISCENATCETGCFQTICETSPSCEIGCFQTICETSPACESGCQQAVCELGCLQTICETAPPCEVGCQQTTCEVGCLQTTCELVPICESGCYQTTCEVGCLQSTCQINAE